MRVLLYAKASNELGGRLRKLLEAGFPGEEMEICQTFESLVQTLREPLGDSRVAVLLPSDRKDLMDLVSIKHLFRNIPVVLLIPDFDRNTISMAHQLRPRFVSDFGDDLELITQILKKMGKGYP